MEKEQLIELLHYLNFLIQSNHSSPKMSGIGRSRSTKCKVHN